MLASDALNGLLDPTPVTKEILVCRETVLYGLYVCAVHLTPIVLVYRPVYVMES